LPVACHFVSKMGNFYIIQVKKLDVKKE